MDKQSNKERAHNQQQVNTPSALEIVSEYVAALAARDSERMNSLRSPDFVLDFMHGDAFEDDPLSDAGGLSDWEAAGYPLEGEAV